MGKKARNSLADLHQGKFVAIERRDFNIKRLSQFKHQGIFSEKHFQQDNTVRQTSKMSCCARKKKKKKYEKTKPLRQTHPIICKKEIIGRARL